MKLPPENERVNHDYYKWYWKEKMKFSVIIPVYNASKFIDYCVESVLSQSYSDIEVILINDGSTDKSGEICEGSLEKIIE